MWYPSNSVKMTLFSWLYIHHSHTSYLKIVTFLISMWHWPTDHIFQLLSSSKSSYATVLLICMPYMVSPLSQKTTKNLKLKQISVSSSAKSTIWQKRHMLWAPQFWGLCAFFYKIANKSIIHYYYCNGRWCYKFYIMVL